MSRQSDHHQLELDRIIFGERVAKELLAENTTNGTLGKRIVSLSRLRKRAIIRRVLRGNQAALKHDNANYNPFSKAGKKRRARIGSIIRRDGDTCWICKDPFDSYEDITIDHELPISDGGSSKIENLRITHDECNQEKGGTHRGNSKLYGLPSKPKRKTNGTD